MGPSPRWRDCLPPGCGSDKERKQRRSACVKLLAHGSVRARRPPVAARARWQPAKARSPAEERTRSPSGPGRRAMRLPHCHPRKSARRPSYEQENGKPADDGVGALHVPGGPQQQYSGSDLPNGVEAHLAVDGGRGIPRPNNRVTPKRTVADPAITAMPPRTPAAPDRPAREVARRLRLQDPADRESCVHGPPLLQA